MRACGRIVMCALAFAGFAVAQIGPRPGEVYREYKRTMRGPSNWRVTDPATRQDRAHQHLPNAVLPFEIDDLEHAVRAEVLIDRWGGHAGTTVKRIRFNENKWIFLPELSTTPPGHPPERYLYQDNPIVAVPLEDLRQGENVVEGTTGGQIGTGLDWGQWGWTGFVVRVYYDPAKKEHLKGRVASPSTGETLAENPEIRIETEKDTDLSRVDVLARYEGYDYDGDGEYADWQREYRHNRKGPDGPDEPSIRLHAGTDAAAPFAVTWETLDVPDQPQPTVGLLARIQSKDGLWFVSEAVTGLRLLREGESVRLYKPYAVPEKFCARAGNWMMSKFSLPPPEPEWEPVEATLHLRTWNGVHQNMWINGWKTKVGGLDHEYAYTRHDVALDALRQGENRVEFFSEKIHHCIEILWPGPGLTVRYRKAADKGKTE